MRRKYKEQTLGEAIREVLAKYKIQMQKKEEAPVVIFKSLFGNYVLDAIEDIKTFNKILYITFNNHEVRYEIRKGKEQIMNTINDQLVANKITDIKFL